MSVILCLLLAGAARDAMPPLTIAPAPDGEALCEWYTLTVDDQPVPVYSCRVSAVPFNQVWPGYQRPLDQTETAGFATWDMAGPVRVVVESQREIETVAIKPDRLGLAPTVEGRRISFELAEPGPLVVQVNGKHHALHLFANPPGEPAPEPGPNSLIFPPGVHRPGVIQLRSNQSVYLAPGAVVYGSLHGAGVENVRVWGRGILDQAPYARGEGGGAVSLRDCRNIVIEGLVFRDPDVWCCTLARCREVTIRGIHAVGLWRYNADGIDVCNSERVTVERCFVRAFDDALVVKGLKLGPNPGDDPAVRDVTFRGCTVWCDWGRNLEIGAETCAPEIANVVFEDCDLIHATHIAMDIQHGDRATIRDIVFRDIRVDLTGENPRPAMQNAPDHRYEPAEGYLPSLAVIVIRGTPYSKDPERGVVRGVVFENIAITAPRVPHSSFAGADAEHTVDGVVCRGWTINGEPVTALAAMGVQLGEHVANVRAE